MISKRFLIYQSFKINIFEYFEANKEILKPLLREFELLNY